MIPPPAHNPAGLTASIAVTLLLVPLSYGGVSLVCFLLGSIGSGRGILRPILSALFCSLLIFCLLMPAAVWLQLGAGNELPMEQPGWLTYGKAALFILALGVPLLIGRTFTKLSWLRVSLITVGITFSSAVILALLFAFGVFMAVMSQA